MTKIGILRSTPANLGMAGVLLMLVAAPLLSPARAGGCTYTWDGGAATSAWEDAANWTPDGVPGDTVPNFEVACIGSSFAVELSSTINLDAVDIDGSLTVEAPGALFINYNTTSSITDLTLDAGTLGGAGTVTITDTFNWTSRTDGASTQTTRPLNEIDEGPLAVPPGKTIIGPSANLNINGPFGHSYDPGGPNGTYGCDDFLCGGVNLRDERIIENKGTTTLSNAGFIAADDGTTFKNTATGRFVFENDRGYYQGFLVPGPARSKFINNGSLVKKNTLAADGPFKTSVIDSDYNQNDPGDADRIRVKAGAITVPNGTGTRSAEVVPTAALGTGACATGKASCRFPEVTAADKQTSWVQLPGKANKAKIKIVERDRGNAPVALRSETAGGTQTRPIGEIVSVKLTGDPRSRGAPIKVAFEIHKSDLNGETNPKQVELRIDGNKVRKCSGPAGKVEPLPACLSSRKITNEGHYKASVLTTAKFFYSTNRIFTARRYK